MANITKGDVLDDLGLSPDEVKQAKAMANAKLRSSGIHVNSFTGFVYCAALTRESGYCNRRVENAGDVCWQHREPTPDAENPEWTPEKLTRAKSFRELKKDV